MTACCGPDSRLRIQQTDEILALMEFKFSRWEVDYKQVTNCNAWMSGGDECCGRRRSGRQSEWLGRNCDLAEGAQGKSSHAGRPDSCVVMTKLNQSPA